MNNNTNSLYTYILIVFLGLAMIQMQNIGTYRSGSSPSITENDIMDHIRYLSHKDRAGRYPGTRESKDVISYLIRHLKSFGVKPGGENGSFVQPFNITDGIELGKNNSLIIDGDSLATGHDYMPLWFSGNQTVSASAVFAGYGFSIDEKELKWNDYNGLDVEGKWVIVMRHGPERNNQHSLYTPHSGLHKKMLVARDKGALGIIYVSQVEDTDIYPLKYIAGYSNAGIPAIHLSNEIADKLFETVGWTRKNIQKTMNQSFNTVSLKLPVTIKASADLNPIQIRAANVVGLIESGNRKYRNEYVVIGAHFDHIGMGGTGTGSRKPDTTGIHSGADDNASGTAGLLEIAQKLVSQKSRLKRSVLLLGFDAEEKGLLGAKYFTENPLVELQNIVAMINLDMIGRMKDSSITVGGVGTSPLFELLLNEESVGRNFTINMTKPGYGPSDHAAFYTKDIPVLFFFTGFHNEYHTPEDSWKLINLKGEKDILDLVYDVTFQLSRLSERPVFTEAGPKEGRMQRNTKFKVTFGIIPAYGSTKKGLEVDGISKPDGPAAKAGMLKGDVIKSMDGKPINDIYEFMDRLEKLEPGMTITVLIDRNGTEIELPVTF
jgi:aminopeptidase YwaD